MTDANSSTEQPDYLSMSDEEVMNLPDPMDEVIPDETSNEVDDAGETDTEHLEYLTFECTCRGPYFR